MTKDLQRLFDYKKYQDSYFIILAIFLAILANLLASKNIYTEQIYSISQGIADLFLKFLQLMSAPIVFLAIITNFLSISGQSHLKSYSKKVLIYTVITTITAATLAYILFQIIQPADITNINNINNITNINSVHQTNNISYVNQLFKLIPNNIVQAFSENNILGIALIAAIMGYAMMQIPKKQQESLALVFSGLFHTFINIARFIITALPVGIFAFTVLFLKNLSTPGNSLVANGLGKYISIVILANIIQGFIVLPLLLKYKKLSPIKLFKSVYPALTTAFFSKSSSATLPLTMDCMIERHKTKEALARFTLPICTIINMNGCAAFIYTTVLFVALQNGLVFTTFDYIIWIFIATIVAIGNASIPMGCYFLSSAILLGMGVKLDLMVLILPIYTLFDMIETALNVWSDCCVTDIVANEVK